MSKQEFYKWVVQILRSLNVYFVDPCDPEYVPTLPPGPYRDDDDAAMNGIAVGQKYLLSIDNNYGIPVGNGGIEKIRMQ